MFFIKSMVQFSFQSYGGIRGAVSFSLAILLSDVHFPLKTMFVTTTIFIVLFTVFFQVCQEKINKNWIKIVAAICVRPIVSAF